MFMVKWFTEKLKEKQRAALMIQSAVATEFTPGERALVANLEPQEQALITGTMGGCCSLVFLWEKAVDQNYYNRVRGQHGAGGPQALDFATLAADVPTNKNTIMIMICAPADFANYAARCMTFGKPRHYSMQFVGASCATIRRDASCVASDERAEIAAWIVRRVSS